MTPNLALLRLRFQLSIGQDWAETGLARVRGRIGSRQVVSAEILPERAEKGQNGVTARSGRLKFWIAAPDTPLAGLATGPSVPAGTSARPA